MKNRPHQDECLEAMANETSGIIHLPTGSGKTRILISHLVKGINKNKGKHFVGYIVAPKIILGDQLLHEIKEQLIDENIQAMYHIVNSSHASGNIKDNITCQKKLKEFLSIEITSSTRIKDVKEKYENSKKVLNGKPLPLILIGTYASAGKVAKACIHIDQLHYDEAHYLCQEDFNAYVTPDDKEYIKADQKYFYTATLRHTASDKGVGMNNADKFGTIVYCKKPVELVSSGDILAPRMHIVSTENKVSKDDVNADVAAVLDSFKEHKILLDGKTGSKMLVVTKGTEHLKDISTHPKMQEYIKMHPGLKVFDISSKHKFNINGQPYSKKGFMKDLKGLDDMDDAIIFHVRILTEGIDVPGITGVMFFQDTELANFLQNLGRATRLHKTDRDNIHNKKTVKPNETNKMYKSYAWVIIPSHNELGMDLQEHLKNFVYGLRDYNFNPMEHIFIKDSKGVHEPVAINGLNEMDERKKLLSDMAMQIEHEIESEEDARRVKIEDIRLEEKYSKMSIDELAEAFTI